MTPLDRHGEPARCCSVAEAEARDGVRVLDAGEVQAAGERIGAGMTQAKWEDMGPCLEGANPPCLRCGEAVMPRQETIASGRCWACSRCGMVLCWDCWLGGGGSVCPPCLVAQRQGAAT
jgi:hypothetical protein